MRKSPKNILILEDDAFLAMDAESAATTLGYDPVVVTAQSDALNFLDKEKVIGAVLDFLVDDGNSARVASHLEKNNVPYCVVSGSDIKRITDAGIPETRIVAKPARYERVIKRLLGRSGPAMQSPAV